MDKIRSSATSVFTTVTRAGVALLNALPTLVVIDARAYRPEKYYMRGPGPKWREKHAHKPARVPSVFR